VVAATVYDFKTDAAQPHLNADAMARRYAAQLETYRRVAAVLTGLAVDRVAAVVVLTSRGEAITLAGRVP
jgi:hypothetical protein